MEDETQALVRRIFGRPAAVTDEPSDVEDSTTRNQVPGEGTNPGIRSEPTLREFAAELFNRSPS